MPNTGKSSLIAAFSISVAVGCTASAAAHQFSMSAYPEGDFIGGDIRLGSGQPGEHVLIQVWLASGKLVDKVETDSSGHFTYRPTEYADHVFVYDPGDGHRCEARFSAAALPSRLHPEAEGESSASPCSHDDLRVVVEEAVSKQIAPLRRDFEAARHAVRVRDVVGGLGYIMGIVGIYCFVRSRRAASS
jgi:nickel transport protein